MRAPAASILCVVCGLCIGSCARESKVVRWRPFFAGTAEAQHQTSPVNASMGVVGNSSATPAVEAQPDGSVVLQSPSIRHLMSHVLRTLADEDPDRGRAMFLTFVAGPGALAWFAEQGVSPEQGYDALRLMYNDVYTLFSRLPMAELTPTATMRTTGPRSLEVRVAGNAGDRMAIAGLEVERTREGWRLARFLR